MIQFDKWRRQARATLLAAAVACSLIGCSDDPYGTATVQGRLTCGGTPVPSGVVRFAPLDAEDSGRKSGFPGKPATGVLNENGEFVLTTYERGDGALIGRHEVSYVPLYSPLEIREMQDALKSNELPADTKASLAETLDKYLAQPKLNCGHAVEPNEVTVGSGRNTFELKLTSKE